jgi:hypothetical protein
MVILLSLNFPYENQKCSLMFCRAGQDFYGSQLFGSSFIFETLQYASETSSRLMKASSELRSALLVRLCRTVPSVEYSAESLGALIKQPILNQLFTVLRFREARPPGATPGVQRK